jgi:hypothetical protein
VTEWHRVLANVLYDDYHDAIHDYASLSNTLFAKRLNKFDLTIENAAEATGYGDGSGALIGNPAIALVFIACKEGCQWSSPTWN